MEKKKPIILENVRKENEELKKEIALLKAKLWVAKDSQLRTYDGLTEKADKYDLAVQALKKINEQELNSQRPGGGHSISATISYDTLKTLGEY